MRLKHLLVKMILINKINQLNKTLWIKGKMLILKIKIPKTVKNNRQRMIKKQSISKLIKVILMNKL